MEDKKKKQCKEVFNTICKTLDEKKWVYKTDEEKMMISFGVTGEDIPMDFYVVCNEESLLVKFTSFLPFKVAEEKRVEFAVAVSLVNYKISEGCFIYNICDGMLGFSSNVSFMDSLIGKQLFDYMINLACYTVDLYNDKFLMLSKGNYDLTKFLEEISK